MHCLNSAVLGNAYISGLVRVGIAVLKQGSKTSKGGKGLFGLGFHIIVHHWRKSEQELKQNRNLKTRLIPRPWTGAVHSLAYSFCIFIAPKIATPGVGLPTLDEDLPHQ